MSRPNDTKGQIFEKEHRILAASKVFLEKDFKEVSSEELRQEYEVLSQTYGELLGEVKLLTSVSDRLQNRLNRANETVVKRNEELKEAQDLLNKTKIAKKATNIILVAAVMFYLVSEWMVDPLVANLGSLWGHSLSLFLKFGLAISLPFAKKVLEHFLLQTANQPVQDLT